MTLITLVLLRRYLPSLFRSLITVLTPRRGRSSSNVAVATLAPSRRVTASTLAP
jgi:hypothetical protein